jgi:hypothetical protein
MRTMWFRRKYTKASHKTFRKNNYSLIENENTSSQSMFPGKQKTNTSMRRMSYKYHTSRKI